MGNEKFKQEWAEAQEYAEKVWSDIIQKAALEGQDWLTGLVFAIVAGKRGKKPLMAKVRGNVRSEIEGFKVGLLVRNLMIVYFENQTGAIGKIVADIVSGIVGNALELPGEDGNGSPDTDS